MEDFFTDELNEGILLYFEMWQQSTLGDEYRFGGNYCRHVQGSYIPEYRYLDIHLRENSEFSQAGSLCYDTQFKHHETCQLLYFPPNGLRAQSRVSPVVGLLPSASGPACLGMAFPPFLMKQLYRCDSVVISSFVRTGCTTRKWGWLYTQRVKHHLKNTKENETDMEKERKNLQNIIKSAANESLRTIKKRNRRKYLKIWDDQIKQLIETENIT